MPCAMRAPPKKADDMTRAVTNAGHELARRFEKRVLHTYDDADPRHRRVKPGHKFRGTPTIGWGNVRHAMPVRTITPAEAESLYAEDVQETIRTIYRHVPHHVIELLPQSAYDALFSMTFNTGPQIYVSPGGRQTNFIKALMSPERALEVPIQMRRWNKTTISGKLVVSNGLTIRREAEALLWTQGYQTSVSREQAAVPLDTPPEVQAEIAAKIDTRITPVPPQPAISQGTPAQRPATGAVATTAGVAGAAITETAQQMNLLGAAGQIVQLICLLLVLVGLGLTIYAVVHQTKKGQP
jgi:lysozyme